jgi:hypothetical protein
MAHALRHNPVTHTAQEVSGWETPGMRRSLIAAAVLLPLVGCSSGTTKTSSHQASPRAVVSSTSPSPRLSPSSTASDGHAGNITLSSGGRYLTSGPFKITPIKCGPYTAAEKTEFGTNANGGLVFSYTNQGNTLTDGVILTVNFSNGSTVVGENVNGDPTRIGPGQTATAAVDALSGGGADLTFADCEVMGYMLPEGGATFAP